MKSYFILLFFLFTGSILAQDIVLTATVISEEGTAIPLVNIYSKKSSNGCVSDANGVFSIKLSKKNQVIRLSHVGYKTLEYKLNLKNLETDTLYHSFTLKKDVGDLEEVELKGGDIVRAYNKPKIRILDFDFYEDGFIMLIAEDDVYKLRWIGPNEELVYDIFLERHPKDLYKDCFDQFFVVYRASVEQVFVGENKCWLEKTCSMKTFERNVKPCVASSGSYVYFSKFSHHNQGLKYFKWDERTQESSLLVELFDLHGYANAAGEMAYINSLGGVGGASTMGSSRSSVQIAHKIEDSYEFYKNILARPEYQPLLKFNNQLLLCNHMVDTAYVYSFDGEIERSFPIDYHYQKGWKEVIVDASGENLFAKCQRDGMAFILEIDTNTGEVIRSTRMEKHTFPATIRIKDHIAYYLYKDTGYFTETNIYQQTLY